MRKRCTNHCSGCGSHFTSLAAFDAHRSGPWSGERLCWAEDNEHAAKLTVLTSAGVCDLTAHFQQGVSIWGDPVAAARVRAAFSGRNEITGSDREAA